MQKSKKIPNTEHSEIQGDYKTTKHKNNRNRRRRIPGKNS